MQRSGTLHAAAALAEREHLLIRGKRGYSGAVSEMPDKVGAIAAAVAAFSESRVPFALIGGLTVGIRSGVPRATLDVDFAVTTSADRAKLAARLAAGGFRLTGQFAHSVNFLHESGEPVQLAFDAADIALLEGDVPERDEGW
jgi:hypothetical protein